MPAHRAGHSDALEYHQRLWREVEQGARAMAMVFGWRIQQLSLGAPEVSDGR